MVGLRGGGDASSGNSSSCIWELRHWIFLVEDSFWALHARVLSGFPHCSRSISQRDDDRIGDRSPQRIPEPGYRRGHWNGVGPRALFQRGECLFGIDRLFGPMLPRSSIQKFLQAGKT